MKKFLSLSLALLGLSLPFCGASFYPLRLTDAAAVYLTGDRFDVKADGKSDDSAALQAAIDKVQETTGGGILFVPHGRYRITRTIYVWPGIRVIGYGAERPVIVLGDRTPGYQEGVGDMFFFAGGRPTAARAGARGNAAANRYRPPETPPGTVPPNPQITDANPGTFYSAMSNVDFEIGDGNPAAVAVRFHAAQHSYLAHMDFRIGSGLAGIHDVGNEAEDLHFYGGRYGILTKKPSPAWQFTLLDSSFEGQREAAIRENEAGLTLVRDEFKNVPAAIAIDPGYSDELWVKESRFQNISGPAITISNEKSRLTEINTENVVCRGVPVFARFRESGRRVAGPGDSYEVKTFSYGLTLADLGAAGVMKMHYDAAPLKTTPAPLPAAIIGLPPMGTWVNLRTLGARGDGRTDDTAVIQKAIAEHRVVYVPSGFYIVSDTIKLRADTVLIGLHPDRTQFDLLDSTPGFQGPGAPRALLEAPVGGTNIVTGIGIFTGGINSRAVGALWMAGKDSLMDDVRFLGGHGTSGLDGKRINPYNNTHTNDPDIHRRWDSQFPSLWITNGGGGTFANIWTPDTFAQAGLYISDTTTPGRVYELSSEHHVRNEIKLKHAANWDLYAPQTEEESGESPFALSLEIDDSHDITIANYHGYRVTRSYQPFPFAVRISHSHDIRFRNVHIDANSSAAQCEASGDCQQFVRANKVSYANAIFDQTIHAEVRDREFAWLDLTGKPVAGPPRKASSVLETGASVMKLSSGFFNLSGAAVDAAGDLYFADPHWQRIYKWASEKKDLTILRDDPLEPVNLVFDKAGDLVVVSSGGDYETVYSFRPDAPEGQIAILPQEEATERPGMAAVLPVSYWVNGDFSNTLNTKTYEYITLDEMFTRHMTTRKRYQYVSPDRSLFIPADKVYLQGEPRFGNKWSDILQTFELVKAVPGRPFYVTNESEEKTYKGKIDADGTLSDLHLFATQGGECLAQDKEGNVYLVAGQIFVYSPAGKLIDRIDVPERPNQLVFGGKDRRTLYILSSDSLYSVRTRSAGL